MDVYLPKQDVSDSKKQQEEWYIPTYDYYIYNCFTSKNNNDTNTFINAANGIFDEQLLDYLIKPFNETAESLNEKYPIKLRNTDIITPIVEKIIGEYIELPYKFSVNFHDPDIASMQDAELRSIMENIIKSTIAENLQKQEQTGEPLTPEQIKKLVDEEKAKFIFEETIKARRFLQYINEKSDFDFYRTQMYYNWWTTEETYVVRSIEDGEFVKEIISPQDGFPYLGNYDFVDDGIAFMWIEEYSWDELLMRDRDNLSKSQLDYIDALMGTGSINSPISAPTRLIENRRKQDWYRIGNVNEVDSYLTKNGKTIKKHNLVFRAYRKVKELTYIDLATGKQKITTVPNDYSLNQSIGDIEVKNKVIPEVYYGARYGTEKIGVYTKPTKLLVQRNGKLPVTGKYGILKNKRVNPIPYRLLAYQLIDSMLTVHIEKTLMKYKDDILIIPKSVLAEDKSGTTLEKTYYLMKDGRIIYDDTKVDLQTIVQGLRVVKGSVTEAYLKTLMEIQQYFYQRALESGSLNQDRLGNIDTRGGVSNTEQNIYRSKLGNVLSLDVFRKILEKEHEADLEYAKYLFIDGLNDTMFDEKGQVVTLEINGYANFKRTYGVYVDNGLDVDKKLNQLRQMALNVAQQGEFDQGIAAIKSDSIEEIELAVKKIKAANEEFQARMEQQKVQQQQMAADAASELEDKQQANKERLAELEGIIDENKVVVQKEYDLMIAEQNNAAQKEKNEIDLEKVREGNESRERIAAIQTANKERIEKFKSKQKSKTTG